MAGTNQGQIRSLAEYMLTLLLRSDSEITREEIKFDGKKVCGLFYSKNARHCEVLVKSCHKCL